METKGAGLDAVKCLAIVTDFLLAQDTHKTCTHTHIHTHFVSSHTEQSQLDDRIRADTGRPARLCAMAPSSRAAVCLTNMEDRGARATATLCPQAVRHSSHCHGPDISSGQRWWHRAPATGICLNHSLQPHTSAARSNHGMKPCT